MSDVCCILTRASCAGPSDLSGLVSQYREVLRLAARKVLCLVHQRAWPSSIWGGHSAVTESLVQGLKETDSTFHFDPVLMPNPASQRIGVLAGLSTLRWALAYASSRHEVRLSVGPNVFVTPLQARAEVEADCVDQVIVPSQSVADFYASELPTIAGKLRVWMAGVDADYWRPSEPRAAGEQGPVSVVVYVKTDDLGLVRQVGRLCERLGLRFATVEYGSYSPRQFLRALQGSDAMVVLGSAESQGLAMFEAWSANVPTLVHTGPARKVARVPGVPDRLLPSTASASPYLSRVTGRFWTELDDLESCLAELPSAGYTPRAWVLEHAQRRDAAQAYLRILNEGA